MQAIYHDFSEESINAAIATLASAKSNFLWGGESLKFDMASGKTDVEVALMWSCDAGYVMNDYEDDDGVEHTATAICGTSFPKRAATFISTAS
ncbi:MAG: hypothetical protein ACLUSP_08350 [Christensenellales bacterium]